MSANDQKNEVVTAVTPLNFVSLDAILGRDSTELLALAMDVVETEKLGNIPVTALSNPEYKTIKKDCMSFIKDGNRMRPDIDDDKLMVEVLIAAVDKDTRSDFTFRNKALLEKLGVTTAAQAVDKLVSPGEIFKGAMTVQDISGFGEKAEKEAKDVIKNS